MASVRLQLGTQAEKPGVFSADEDTVLLRRFRVSITEETDGWLSVSQFADEAGITPQAVRKMIAENRLQAQKIGEQHVISRDELSRYLAER